MAQGLDHPVERTHVSIYEYQKEYLDENKYVIAKVIREAIDDWMAWDGADPDEYPQVYEDE